MQEERYEIRGKIGQGGVGAVYKAYDTHLKRMVAIKRVLADEAELNHENATNNLLKEATALSSVQHPHICTVYDAGIDDDGPFVVMELINGKTLDKMIEKGTLTYDDFREVAIQSLEAMIAAQELNLVHRDLKPSNVMVSWLPSGRFQIKLVDFGLAKFSAKPSLQTIDHGDSVFGSIFFMAPEQFERTPLDQRTDMYSLGALFYYSLTAAYPFDGDTAPQVMASHLQNTVIPLQEVRPDLPIWLCEWVMWHIQRDMAHRPPSALIALEKFLADETLAAQGGMGTTQQMITPGAPRTGTSPVLIIPNTGTGPQGLQAGTITGPLNPATGPQPILTPTGQLSTHTSTHSIKTATSHLTSSVGIQPAGAHPQSPEAAAEEANPLTEEHKPKISQKTKIIIISLLSVLILLVGIKILGGDKENDHLEQFEKIVNQKNMDSNSPVNVTEKDMDIILEAMTGEMSAERPATKNRIAALNILIKSVPKGGKFNLPAKIADFALDKDNDISDPDRGDLLKVSLFIKPHDKDVFAKVMKYASNNPNLESAEKAMAASISFNTKSDIKRIITIMIATKRASMKSLCEKLLKKLLLTEEAESATSKAIVAAYKNPLASKVNKSAFIRLMGSSQSSDALEILLDSLNSENPSDVNNAHRALARWQDIRPFDKLIDALENADSASAKAKFVKTIVQMLRAQKDNKDKKLAENWQTLTESTPDANTAFKVIKARVDLIKEDWAKAALTKLLEDQSLKTNYKRTAKEILEEWSDQ